MRKIKRIISFKEMWNGVYFSSEAEKERAGEGEYSSWDNIKYHLLFGLDLINYNLNILDDVNEIFGSLLHSKKLKRPRWYCVDLDKQTEVGVCYRDFKKYGVMGRRILLFNLEDDKLKENSFIKNTFNQSNPDWLCVDLDNDENISTCQGKIEIKTRRGPITGSRLFMVDLKELALQYRLQHN